MQVGQTQLKLLSIIKDLDIDIDINGTEYIRD